MRARAHTPACLRARMQGMQVCRHGLAAGWGRTGVVGLPVGHTVCGRRPPAARPRAPSRAAAPVHGRGKGAGGGCGAPGGPAAASGAAASGTAASGALHTLTHTWSCRIDFSCISRTKCSSHVPGSRPSVRRQRVLRWLNRLVSVETAVTPQGGSSVTRLVYVSEKARKPSVSVASKLAGPWRAQMREAEQNGRNSVYRSTSATTA